MFEKKKKNEDEWRPYPCSKCGKHFLNGEEIVAIITDEKTGEFKYIHRKCP
jgi:hypothetical protein